MNNCYPVILCGGDGTRLWPLSRQQRPKQFVSLTNEHTMLQNTLLRLPKGLAQPLFICHEQHRFSVAEQSRELALLHPKILLEPEGKNTAPAIALAALEAVKTDPDAVLIVLASDHDMTDNLAFQRALQVACELAVAGKLVTFGIVPDSAHTGYGYIKRGAQVKSASTGYQVAQFVEKPDLATATAYVSSGEYYWNSGMFVFKASVYLAELQQFQPDMYKFCQQAMLNTKEDIDFIRIDADAFAQSPAESVDYAVMEHTQHAVVVPLDAGWSDVGSWSALWQQAEKDAQQNVLKGDVLTDATTNCYIHGADKLIATIGLDNIVIVDTPDALLVANKDNVQNVKDIVARLEQQQRTEHNHHREVYRPWGKYDSIDNGGRFQVKRITVNPGAKLSVQMHHHRAEHWIVVSGTARVRNGEQEFLLTENQSTYIPIGVTHSLENPGKLPLELIEVQSGAYLGEDDIVRFEDKYGRGN